VYQAVSRHGRVRPFVINNLPPGSTEASPTTSREQSRDTIVPLGSSQHGYMSPVQGASDR